MMLREALKICVKKSIFFILCGEYAFFKNLESNKLTGNVCSLCKSRKTGKIWLRKYLLRKILLENSRFLHESCMNLYFSSESKRTN